MEANVISEATDAIELALPKRDSGLVAVPQDYFLGPIFAASKQSGPREVSVRVKDADGKIVERRYFMGGFHPLRPNHPPPALDVRHGRAIFALLSFRDPFDETRLIRFSFNELCRKYAKTNGGRYARAIREILADLTDSYIRVLDVKTDVAHTYRLIEKLVTVDKPIRRKDSALAVSGQREMWFEGCTLSPEFYSLLNRIAELRYLKLDVFTSIRSPLAQAIYLYIPSRAYHHAEDNPFEIALTKLLEQVSFPVPQYKSVRQKLFTQNANSIIKQLDGLELYTGRFRVALDETADGSDGKLLAWVEKTHRKPELNPEKSKLLAAYIGSGRPREFFDEALKKQQPLSYYETDLLERGGVQIAHNRRFFEMTKALLGMNRFATFLAEAKNDAQEGRRATKNPTARLIHRLMQAISTPPSQKAPAA
jgi:hypothetical protein